MASPPWRLVLTIVAASVLVAASIAQGPAPGPGPFVPPGQLGNFYGRADAKLRGQSNDAVRGHMHLIVFQSGSALNVLYLLVVRGLSAPTPPTNATITSGRDGPVALSFAPVKWTNLTCTMPGRVHPCGSMGGMMGGMMNGTRMNGSSFAATGTWINANATMAAGGKSVADVATAVAGDPGSFYGHVATASDGDASGQFEVEE